MRVRFRVRVRVRVRVGVRVRCTVDPRGGDRTAPNDHRLGLG